MKIRSLKLRSRESYPANILHLQNNEMASLGPQSKISKLLLPSVRRDIQNLKYNLLLLGAGGSAVG
jgi:hypothetical protein